MGMELPGALARFGSRDDFARYLAEVAVAAGRNALRLFEQGCGVATKRDGSPVTAADLETQRLIAARLRQQCPGLPICGEEGEELPLEGGEAAFLLVDPVDGTKEFIRGSPEWTVNIALVGAGRPIAGAVAAPAQRRVFWGGDSAFSTADQTQHLGPGTPLQVRSAKLDRLSALCSRDHQSPEADLLLQRLGVTDVRPAGSSLKILRIAAGEADIYPRFGPTMAWDTAAAQAVLAAAGGNLFTCAGNVLTYDPRRLQNPPFVAFGADRLPQPVIKALQGLGAA